MVTFFTLVGAIHLCFFSVDMSAESLVEVTLDNGLLVTEAGGGGIIGLLVGYRDGSLSADINRHKFKILLFHVIRS